MPNDQTYDPRTTNSANRLAQGIGLRFGGAGGTPTPNTAGFKPMYTDGAPDRNSFYIDDIILASDLPGYGAPTGVDAAGNAYIDPATRVGDLA